MLENEFSLRSTIPQLEVAPFDREANSHIGRLHIEQAAAEMRGDIVLLVTQTILRAGLPQSQVIETLGLRGSDDKRIEGIDQWNRMRLNAQLFGEDPGPRLRTVRLDRPLTQDTAYGVIMEHIQVGSIYNLIGETDEAKRVFYQAEEIIDAARDSFNQAGQESRRNGSDYHEAFRAGLEASALAGQHDTSYNRLADAYADEGMYEDSLRVIDKLREDESHYIIPSTEHLSEIQSNNGFVDEAVVTANRLGGPLVAKALARKAILEAQYGGDYRDTIGDVERRINNITSNLDYMDFRFRQTHLAVQGGNPMTPMMHMASGKKPFNEDVTVEILSLMGEAVGKGGDFKSSEQYFRKALDLAHGQDALFQPRLLLYVAKGVGGAGFDSREFYKETFRALQELGEPGDENTEDLSLVDAINPWLRWGPWEGAIKGLADEGHFDLARQWLPGFTPQKSSDWYERNRVNLLAYVGIREVLSSNQVS